MAYNETSESVIEDFEAQLSFDGEFFIFFEGLRTVDPHRYQKIKNIAGDIELSPDTVCIVLIPCHLDEDNLRRSLQSFLGQDHDNFEIIIFLNAGPETSEQDFFDESRRLEAEIAEVAQEGDLRIHSFAQHFTKKPVMGDLRAILSEVACICAKSAEVNNPILINNDADTVFIHPNYIGIYEDHFRNNQRTDYATGPINWDAEYNHPDAMSKEIPELLIEQKLDQLAFIFVQKFYGSKFHYPANLAVRASSYMASGGFDKSMSCFEDASLTSSILSMRADSMYGEPAFGRDVVTAARLSTSARRSLSTILERQSMYDQWENFNDNTYHAKGEAELVSDYKNNEYFIQVDDISGALEGDSRAIEKMEKRLKLIVERLIIRHSLLRRPELISNFLRFSGLKLRHVDGQDDFKKVLKFSRDPGTDRAEVKGLEIDISASGRGLEYLARFFSSES